MYSTTVVSQMIEGLTAIRVDENGAETVEPGIDVYKRQLLFF